MIRIRYRDFSYGTHNRPGLHGIAEASPDGVTVYLLPGLACSQRRAVLRRLRQEASRGCGPALPLLPLALALGADRIRWARRDLTALVRLHPARIMLSALVVAAAMALFVLASAASRAGEAAGSTTPAHAQGHALPAKSGTGGLSIVSVSVANAVAVARPGQRSDSYLRR